MTSLLDEIFPATAARDPYPWTGRIGELPSHLSATQMSMFQRCAEQYRRRYVLGEKERPRAALIWGGADHAAHEENFRQKITSGEDVPVDVVEDAFATAFDRKVDEAGGLGEVEWGDEKPADLKDAGAALVAAYHRQVSPSVQPVSVEREFKLELPGVPIPVVGRMDIETELPAIERKTAKRAEKTVKPTWRIQGLLYQLVEKRPVVWHVSVKTKVPAIYTQLETPGLSMAVSDATLGAAERLVGTTAQTIEAFYSTFGPEQPWPGAISHDWACSWCAYKSRCAWWGNS